jgi:hypothetical protein
MKDQKTEPKLTAKGIDAWEQSNAPALRAALAKAERDVKEGRGVPFDPMKPRALLKRIISLSKRRRAA